MSLTVSPSPRLAQLESNYAPCSSTRPSWTCRRSFVVLERACLEAYKVSSTGKSRKWARDEAKYTLLNCDNHQGFLANTGRNIADAQPDITHQCLLTFLDSPLNKAGRL